MHIPDGVLRPEVLAGGWILTAGGLAYGCYRYRPEDIPRTSLLTAAFACASSIHVPIGPIPVHLVLNGLLGVFLGRQAVVAIFIGLGLQAIMIHHGGITSLGVNTVMIGFPAVILGGGFRWALRGLRGGRIAASLLQGGLGFFLGGGAVLFSAVLASAAYASTGEGFYTPAKINLMAHLPVALVEGIVCAILVVSIGRSSFREYLWKEKNSGKGKNGT
jgi:cobalt/nickel transport system permease protein